MSIFSKKAFAHEKSLSGIRKNQRITQVKVKFGKKEKTVNCSICGLSGTKIRVNNQTFKRCKTHIIQLNSRNDKYIPVFKKANKL